MQNRKGRRGFNFTIRVTGAERRALEALRGGGYGPRRGLGPWLVWHALSGNAGAGGGSAGPGPAVCPSSGIAHSSRQCRAGRAIAAPRPIILDLCAGSGAWSAPYELAGYDVRRVSLPEIDVRTFEAPTGVHGVLAAPPCDQFSLARNGHPELSRDFAGGLECVTACLRIVAMTRPQWWALENPVGLLSRWLGTPLDVFEPCDFGDPWTKRTALWGSFALPERGPFVEPVGGGPLCALCDPDRRKTTWCGNAAHRAVTPAGFAAAFFRANP